jgi:hypothetical protein
LRAGMSHDPDSPTGHDLLEPGQLYTVRAGLPHVTSPVTPAR